MKKEIERESNSNLIIIILIILILIVMIIGFSFTMFIFTNKGEKINSISTGNILLDYKESVNGINITNAFPMKDDVGRKLSDPNQYFDFSVLANIEGEANIYYEISAEKLDDSTLDNKDVKLYLEKNVDGYYQEVMKPKVFTPLTEKTTVGTPKGEMLLIKENITKTEKDQYRLRMWVTNSSIIDDKSRTFKVQVNIHANVKS